MLGKGGFDCLHKLNEVPHQPPSEGQQLFSLPEDHKFPPMLNKLTLSKHPARFGVDVNIGKITKS